MPPTPTEDPGASPPLSHQPSPRSPVLRKTEDELDRRQIRECLDGRPEAYGELVGRYEKLLYNLALRMSGDRDDARDIVQSAFVKAYRKLNTFDPRFRFFSWIYRIVINETLTLIDRRKRLAPIEADQPWPHRNPEEDFGSGEVAERVQEAIAHLPPDYRQAVLLRHWADLSYRDIAETLGIPEKTVKSRLYTARRLLEEILTRKGVVPT